MSKIIGKKDGKERRSRKIVVENRSVKRCQERDRNK